MKSDAQLQNEVLADLKWDPVVNVTDVAERCAAERATQRVHGVKALAIELTVKPPSPREIAAGVTNLLRIGS